jgi:hypothetical protein
MHIFVLVATKCFHIKMCYTRNFPNIHCVIFEDLTTFTLNTVFWDVTPCVLVQIASFRRKLLLSSSLNGMKIKAVGTS